MSTTSPNSDSSKSSRSVELAVHEISDDSVCFFTGNKCTGSLAIIDELNRLYEERMRKIEERGGGDCVKAKISLQQRWIRDLKEQNAALVEAVEELEREAAERVEMLERKLRTSAQEVVTSTARAQDAEDQLKKATEIVESLTGDVKNLVRFIRRAREDGVWSTDGMEFRTVSREELLGRSTANGFINYAVLNDAPDTTHCAEEVCDRVVRDLSENKDLTTRSLQLQLNQLSQYGGIQELVDKSKDYEALKKSMSDMRDALTAEVANKHDTILGLRREVQQLEEQCLQADKQTLFKDDIVRELRKEIKQLKQKCSKESVPKKSCFLVDDPELIPVISVKKTDVVKKSNSRIIYLRQNNEESAHSKERGHLSVAKSETNAEKTLTPEKLIEKVHSDDLNVCNCEYSGKYRKSN